MKEFSKGKALFIVHVMIGMLSLSEDNQSDVIEAFNSTSRYLDDLLNIENNLFDSMVDRIYPSELQLNKANVSDPEASFLDLHLSISNDFVKTKIYVFIFFNLFDLLKFLVMLITLTLVIRF